MKPIVITLCHPLTLSYHARMEHTYRYTKVGMPKQ